MAKAELRELLLQEEKELLNVIHEAREKLEAIRRLLGDNKQAKQQPAVKKEKKDVKPEGVAKRNETWEDYMLVVLRQLGGKGKAEDVFTYAKKANPTIPESTIKHAVSGKLSKLYRKNKIGANRGVKSEGYEFFLLTNNTLFNAAA